MAWNLVIQWLNEFEDGEEFERLCNDIVTRHQGPVNPSGGTGDRGVDAVLIADPRVVFQYSTNKDWAAKVRKTLRELRDKAVPCKQLIFVTSRKKHSAEEVRLQEEAQRNCGISLQIFDQEFLRLYIERYEELHKYFAKQEQQLKTFDLPDDLVWIAPKIGRDRRRALVMLSTLVRNPESEHLREELAEQLILGSIFGGGDKNVRSYEQIVQGLQNMLGADDAIAPGLIEASIYNLVESGKIYSVEGGYRLSDFAYRDLFDQIQASRHNAVIFQEQLVAEVETQVGLLPEDLGRRVGEVLSGLFSEILSQLGFGIAQALCERRGLEPEAVPEVSFAAAACVEQFSDELLGRVVKQTALRVLTEPTDFEAEYLARIAHSFLAYHCFNLDPQCRMLEQDYIRRHVAVLDTDLIVQALAGRLEYGPVYRSLFARMRDLGIQVYAFTDSISETVYRVELAEKTYGELGKPSALPPTTATYVQDLFIRTFFTTELSDEMSWNEYLSLLVGAARSTEARIKHIEQWLHAEYGIETRGFEQHLNGAGKDIVAEVTPKIVELRQEASTFKHLDLYRSDARLVAIVHQLQNELIHNVDGAHFCWLISSDSVLYRAWQDYLSSRPPMFTPYGWIHYVATFPRSKASPRDFAYFMRALTTSPMQIRVPQRLVTTLIRMGVHLEQTSLEELELLYTHLMSDAAWKLHLESPDAKLDENLDDLRRGIEGVLDRIAEPTKDEVARLRRELRESWRDAELLRDDKKKLTDELSRLQRKERSRRRYLRRHKQDGES